MGVCFNVIFCSCVPVLSCAFFFVFLGVLLFFVDSYGTEQKDRSCLRAALVPVLPLQSREAPPYTNSKQCVLINGFPVSKA